MKRSTLLLRLRCTAAGIIASPRATIEALVPHQKLRKASTSDTTLLAHDRTPAQLAKARRNVLASEYREVRSDSLRANGNHDKCGTQRQVEAIGRRMKEQDQ